MIPVCYHGDSKWLFQEMSIQMIRSDCISGRQRAETNRDGGTNWERVGMFPLMHPTDDKTPSTIHLSVMAVLC